ncbi:hypothetical protein GCM10007103_17220 [Salinimicrobium marinum]|uniref:DUF3298 domain-containing protein n=1 Tax=Salinimicrobium marinum TaxID=680283 RepID=A0A918SFQ7_9FLAO|nr:DUF3298 and DUF4163 domain-containing protein [Salinimicrobium marinum]GHA36270.1 hypothetical protein GCM10007103_17220 [Salinimicrobium marinum]
MTSKYFYFALLLVFVTACKSDKKEPENILFFENESLTKSEGEACEKPENQCTVISLDFPVATGPDEVSGRINKTLENYIIEIVSSVEDTTTTSLEELADDFIADYLSTTSDFPEEPTWEAYVTGKVFYTSANLISIGINSEIFRGGAHGYRALSFLNFNPENGAQYFQEDLFTPEFKDYAEMVFREDQDLPEEDNINSTGFWFEEDTYQLPVNIGFDEDNVILIYNAYEVAPYSAGNIHIEIPKEEVESYLKVE